MTHNAEIEDLVRTSKRYFRLSAFSMHGHHDMPFVPLMLMPIKATPLLGQPFSKRCAFHCLLSYLTWACDVVHAERKHSYEAIINTAIILEWGTESARKPNVSDGTIAATARI